MSEHHLKGNSRMESLCNTIREQIIFQQVSEMTLGAGLYLFYVQAYTTVDGSLNVIVPNTSPSILPYVKIRENSHVTSEEWRWVQQLIKQNKTQPKPPLITGPKSSTNFAGQHASPTTNFLDGEGEEGFNSGAGRGGRKTARMLGDPPHIRGHGLPRLHAVFHPQVGYTQNYQASIPSA